MSENDISTKCKEFPIDVLKASEFHHLNHNKVAFHAIPGDLGIFSLFNFLVFGPVKSVLGSFSSFFYENMI